MDERNVWNAIVASTWRRRTGRVDTVEPVVTIRECRDVAAELDALDALDERVGVDLSDDELVVVLDRAVAAQRLATGRRPWSAGHAA